VELHVGGETGRVPVQHYADMMDVSGITPLPSKLTSCSFIIRSGDWASLPIITPASGQTGRKED
jgi:hypothetical protein